MSTITALLIASGLVATAASVFPASAAAAAPARAAVVSTTLEIGTTHAIRSRVLGASRVVNVVLPPGYKAAPRRRYPVLYLIDGGVEQDLLHVAGAAQLGAVWGRSGEAIVVGIETKDRRKELVGPTGDPDLLKRFPTAGASAEFREFIRAEVKPFVERSYRTNGQDAVMGESLADRKSVV